MTTLALTRFYSKIDKEGPLPNQENPFYFGLGKCWQWTAIEQRQGYGRMRVGSKKYTAHRLSWEIHNNQIPAGLNVLHKCDNKRCVNPEHLFLGTSKDNSDDMIKKGRKISSSGDSSGPRKHPERMARGERHGSKTKPERLARGKRNGAFTKPEKVNRGVHHGRAVLNENDVLQIRERYAAGNITHKKLSREYGVCRNTVSLIINKVNWTHI